MCLPVPLLVCPHLCTEKMHKLNVDQINSFHYWRVSVQLASGGARHRDEPGMCDRLQQWKINWFWTFHCVCCIFCFIYLTVYISSNNGGVHLSGTVQQACSSGSAENMVTCKQTRLLPQMFLQPQETPRRLLFSASPAKTALCVTSSVQAGKLVTRGWEARLEKGAGVIRTEKCDGLTWEKFITSTILCSPGNLQG